MKQLTTLCFTCLIFCSLAAQNSIDSLYARLKQTLHDTDRVNTINALATEIGKSNPDTSIILSTQALNLAEKIKFETGIGKSYHNLGIFNLYKEENSAALTYYNKALAVWDKLEKEAEPDKKAYILSRKSTTLGNIGVIYKRQGNYQMALEYYSKALKIDEENGNEEAVARHFGNIGNVYMEQGNYAQALDNHFKALKQAEATGNKTEIARHVGNIGIIYKEQKDYNHALEYNLKALKLNEELGNKISIAGNYGNIGNIYLEQADYTQALDYYFKAIQLKEELGNTKGISTVCGNIGNAYKGLADYPKALEYFFKALKLDEKTGQKTGIAFQYGNIGSVYTLTGKFKEAEDYLKKSLALFDSTGNMAGTKDFELATALLYDTLAVLKENGKTIPGFGSLSELRKLGYEHYKKHIAARDSINNEEQQKKQVRLEMNYEFDKKEAAAKAEQEKKDALTQAELRKQKIIRNSVAGGLAIVLLFSTVVYRQRNRISKEKKRSEELLLNILPEQVAEELKEKGEAEARLIDEATVLFTDFKGFTAMSEKVSPKELVKDLHECFSAFDHIMQKHRLEKIKTIGDSYMAAGGLPTPNTTHASDAIKAAQEMIQFIEQGKHRKIAAGLPYFEIRIGIHTGPVVAGIVGVKKFQYDIWGDTVNTASRMESSGEVGKINISETTYELVKDKFNCTHRGKITAKGKGEIDMYFVNS